MTEARWIWFRPAPPSSDRWGQVRAPARDAIGHLRHAFRLDAVPSSAPCRVTADGAYELWVNGARIGRGPSRSQRLSYDTYDLAPALREGPNCIAALVRHYGRPVPWWRPSEPRGDLGYGSFLFDLVLDEGAAIASGHGWRARASATTTIEAADAGVGLVPPPSEGPPPLEIVEAASVPFGWTSQHYDDARWEDAYVLEFQGEGFAHMPARESPPLAARLVDEATPIATGAAAASIGRTHPLAAVHEDPDGARPAENGAITVGSWRTFDLGQIVHAHPIIELRADQETVVDLACGEDVTVGGKVVGAPREWAMRIVARGNDVETHEAFEALGFRYLSVAVRRGDLHDVRVRALERIAPRAEGAAFACSDPLIEEIWRAGVRTVDLCSTDTFIDCPGREQRAWAGDAYVVSLIRSVIDPDPALVASTLRLHARGARPDGLLPMVAAGDFSAKRETIPDFSLMWVRGAHAHHARTGDSVFLEEVVPVAERALAWFEAFRADDELLTAVPWWIFIDWAQIERGPKLAVLDAMYAWALDAFAEMCDELGNPGSAERARERAARTRAAFELYWDPRRGVYVDALGPAARGRVSQQTNAMAIVSGCAPRERWNAMLARVLDDARLKRTLTPGDPGSFGERLNRQFEDPPDFDDEDDVVMAQPFFMHFVHRAMIAAGRAHDVVRSLRRWEPMVARGNGCLEEYWTAEPGLGSRCHAWSATPLYDIATCVLGVRAANVGMSDVVVEPSLGDLQWAEGSVATPHGFVHVRARAGEHPKVEVPDGVRVIARTDSSSLG